MQAKDLQTLIENALSCTHIAVSGDDGRHYQATVVSPDFTGLSMLKQHKLVYAALGGRMGGELHALQLTTAIPS